MNDIDSRIQNQFDASEALYEQMQEEILSTRAQLRSLTELLEWASEECATITCEAFPQADGGDYEQAWCVYAHHLNEDEARCIGSGSTIEEALRKAREHEKQTTPNNASAPTKYCKKCDVSAKWSSADCPVCLQGLQEMDFFFHSNPDEPGALTVTNNTDIIQGKLFDRMHHALTYDEKLRAELIAAMQRAKI